MKEIPLTQGKFAIVDDADFEWLNRRKWFARFCKGHWYAYSGHSQILMHRLIMNCPKGKEIDHWNNNGLDNRRANIRECSHSQNMANKPGRSKISKYKGLVYHKLAHKWRARIRCNYRCFHLGLFDSEINAAKAYDKKAKELFGEFAYLNFPTKIASSTNISTVPL